MPNKETVYADEFASMANSGRYTGIKYSDLDCQAFVEEVLYDCGVRKPNGSSYNWKGSNSMWRNALSWKGTIEECRQRYGEIPKGSWVFIVKHDGGEIERGYHDSEGNASHVGIYCRDGATPVRDSTRSDTRDGVGYRSISAFTHVGLPKMINFSIILDDDTEDILAAIHTLRDPKATDETFLNALETVYLYMKG